MDLIGCPLYTLMEVKATQVYEIYVYQVLTTQETYTISGVAKNIARAQGSRVYDQLVAGCRYFDVRLKRYGSTVSAFHGLIRGAKAEEILSDFQDIY